MNEYDNHLNQLNKNINDYIEERPLINDILMKYKSEIETLNRENSLILGKLISFEKEISENNKNLLKPNETNFLISNESNTKFKEKIFVG